MRKGGRTEKRENKETKKHGSDVVRRKGGEKRTQDKTKEQGSGK